jgi:hypothetical protein
VGELDDEVRLASIGTSESLAAAFRGVIPADNPGPDNTSPQVSDTENADKPGHGCEACSWSDTGCSVCRPDVSVFERMKADDAEEDALEARARAAVQELTDVLMAQGGGGALRKALGAEAARTQLQALVAPARWDWAVAEVARRAEALAEAGLAPVAAELGALRSLIRDAAAGELS